MRDIYRKFFGSVKPSGNISVKIESEQFSPTFTIASLISMKFGPPRKPSATSSQRTRGFPASFLTCPTANLYATPTPRELTNHE